MRSLTVGLRRAHLALLALITCGAFADAHAASAAMATVAAATAAETESGALSSYLLEIEDDVVLAGALKPEALASAAPMTIVDLRTDLEGTDEEAAAAAAAGHDYRNLPVAGAVVDPDALAGLKQLLEDPERSGTVVVHCASGNRAALLYGALILERGESLADVQAALAPIMTRQGAIDALTAYADSLGAEP